jgi:LysR family transcriptional regulator, glycine cleavage system transcriptional activator
MPRLTGFLELHPDFDVRLSTSNAIADFTRQDIDVAVRYGTGRWPGLKAQLLFATELFPVCSPSFRNGSQPLRVAADLRPRTLLRLAKDDWPKWLEAAGLRGRRAEGPEFSDAGLLSVTSRRDGALQERYCASSPASRFLKKPSVCNQAAIFTE